MCVAKMNLIRDSLKLMVNFQDFFFTQKSDIWDRIVPSNDDGTNTLVSFLHTQSKINQ